MTCMFDIFNTTSSLLEKSRGIPVEAAQNQRALLRPLPELWNDDSSIAEAKDSGASFSA